MGSDFRRRWIIGRLKYDEFMENAKQILYVSATPSEYEVNLSRVTAEQVIRPTGLLDPPISVRPTEGQIYDLVGEIKKRADRGERVLVTTLTKRLAEELTRFLSEMKLRVRYMHSEIKVLDRVEIIRDLRVGKFDCLIGINLLREGLDLPEVSLVAVLDADKEGFLRSGTALLQTAGRASRNVNGEVLLYADNMTASMQKLIDITAKRRKQQIEFNEKNGIEPKTIVNAMKEGIESYKRARELLSDVVGESQEEYEIGELIAELERDMEKSARNLQFERAIDLRDQIEELRKRRDDDGIGS